MKNKTLAEISPGLIRYLSVKLDLQEIAELESIFNSLVKNNTLEELEMPLRESQDFNPRAARILNILFTDYENADFNTFKTALYSCSKESDSFADSIKAFETTHTSSPSDLILAVIAARLLDDIRHLHLMNNTINQFKKLKCRATSISEPLNTKPQFAVLNRKILAAISAQARKIR